MVFQVLYKKQTLDAAFDTLVKGAKLDSAGRAFALGLTLVTLRRLGGLDHILNDQLLTGKKLAPKLGYARAVLLTGLAQILLMETPGHAAVNESVSLIRRENATQHLAKLANAVLRRAGREQQDLLNILNTDPLRDIPDWVAEGWQKAYGKAGASALAACLSAQPPLDITLKPGVATGPYIEGGGTVLTPELIRFTSARVVDLPGYKAGNFWVQDAAASEAVRLMGNIAGQHVLDLCAAPGGKTMQLAAKGARVTALDRSAKRLEKLRENLARTGLEATLVAADAAHFAPSEPADHILLDAPCSATGTYRRNPDVLWTKGAGDIAKLAALQARLLDHAFALLPVGGKLLYCVCSLEPGEGEDQITRFLARTEGAERLTLGPNETLFPDCLTTEGNLRLRSDKAGLAGGCDGFFIARLTKQKKA